MQATLIFEGGPLDGFFAFDYRPDNLNNTGFALGSNEFQAWMIFDMAYVFGKGQVGYMTGGTTPSGVRRRHSGEQHLPLPCDYKLVQWDSEGGTVFARFRYLDRPEVPRIRAA